jgi:hypothetical protein
MLLVFTLLGSGCSENSTGPSARHFDLQFRYGVLGRNELNTFDNTFTKDLILDGLVTRRLVLSGEELDTMELRFGSIDIRSYPDTFVVPTGDTVSFITPHSTYYLKIRMGSTIKQLFWEDAVVSTDPQAAQLRQVLAFLQALIESKPEYQQLPPARGAYL